MSLTPSAPVYHTRSTQISGKTNKNPQVSQQESSTTTVATAVFAASQEEKKRGGGMKRKAEEAQQSQQPLQKKQETEKRAAGKREIELKVTKVNASQFKQALARAKQLSLQGTFNEKPAQQQEDSYLDHAALKNTPYELYKKEDGSKSFRIRKAIASTGETNHSICLKIARQGSNTDDHERREYELKIENTDEALALFRALGFSPDKMIKKDRNAFTYQDYEIVFDEVKGFKKGSNGYEPEFSSYIVEIELIEGAEKIEDIPACLKQMKEFLEETLHITTYQQEQSGMEKYWNNSSASSSSK